MMLYSCTHMATVGFKGLTFRQNCYSVHSHEVQQMFSNWQAYYAVIRSKTIKNKQHFVFAVTLIDECSISATKRKRGYDDIDWDEEEDVSQNWTDQSRSMIFGVEQHDD